MAWFLAQFLIYLQRSKIDIANVVRLASTRIMVFRLKAVTAQSSSTRSSTKGRSSPTFGSTATPYRSGARSSRWN